MYNSDRAYELQKQLPKGMDDIINILRGYGKIERFYNDELSQYILKPMIEDNFAIWGDMVEGDENALLILYNTLKSEMWDYITGSIP
jgi:hypothetical protein